MCIVNLLLNVDDTERRDVFCPPHCFRTQKSRHLCAEKRREKKKESHVSILYLPVSLYSCKCLDVHCNPLLNMDDTERRNVFCPPHCFRTKKSRHLCAEKTRE